MTEKPYETILVDQDGVLAAFATYNRIVVNAALRYQEDKNQISQIKMIESGCYDISELWNLTREEWWSIIRNDPTFWIDIPMFVWAPDLVDKLRGLCDRLVVSTNPGSDEDPRSPSQKTKWFSERQHILNIAGDDLMIGAQKDLMAKPGVLLVDDSKHNVDAFIKAGGDAVLVPSDWNHRHHGLSVVWTTIEEYINVKREI